MRVGQTYWHAASRQVPGKNLALFSYFVVYFIFILNIYYLPRILVVLVECACWGTAGVLQVD